MNPCPCGYHGHPRQACECHPIAVRTYRNRISGPLLDRIDLHVPSNPSTPAPCRCHRPARPHRRRARPSHRRPRAPASPPRRRRHRLQRPHAPARSPATARSMTPAAACSWQPWTNSRLSARAHDRILKVARTIADLTGADRARAEPCRRSHPVPSARPGRDMNALVAACLASLFRGGPALCSAAAPSAAARCASVASPESSESS
jgi:magnesium chelatase family protein